MVFGINIGDACHAVRSCRKIGKHRLPRRDATNAVRLSDQPRVVPVISRVYGRAAPVSEVSESINGLVVINAVRVTMRHIYRNAQAIAAAEHLGANDVSRNGTHYAISHRTTSALQHGENWSGQRRATATATTPPANADLENRFAHEPNAA